MSYTAVHMVALFFVQKVVHFLSKIHKTVFWLKYCMHQIVYRLRLCPRPTGGAYSIPPDPVAAFRGPARKGNGGEGVGNDKNGGMGKQKVLQMLSLPICESPLQLGRSQIGRGNVWGCVRDFPGELYGSLCTIASLPVAAIIRTTLANTHTNRQILIHYTMMSLAS